jgi:hypothetical protein
VAELAVDFEEGAFRLLDEDQPLGREAEDLAADLRADRPAGAGDEDALAGEEALELGGVEVDGRAL